MAILLQDDASEANGTNVHNKALDVGGNWTVLSGSWEVDSGKIRETAAGAAFVKVTADAGAADIDFEADLTTPATDIIAAGLILRSTDNSNNWWMYLSSFNNTVRLYENVAGSFTERATANFTPAANTTYNLKAACFGNSIDLYIDDVFMCGYASASFQNTATKFGLLTVHGSGFGQSRFDNILGTTPATAPTLSSPAVPTTGTTLTATLSQSGCIPASGTGGFTVSASGGAVTVSGWAISGTTLTLTLSRTIQSGETVTYSYARASTSDDISESTGAEFLADFSGVAVTNNSTQSSSPGTITLTKPVTRQIFQRTTNGLPNGTPGGTTGAIWVEGTYTEDEEICDGIRARFKGGSWVTIDASPSGGVFGAWLTGQGVGNGLLEVSWTNETGVTDDVDNVGVGVLIIAIGQSNSEMHGTNNQSYTNGSGLIASVFRQSSGWANLTDPADEDGAGSAYPLYATQVLASELCPVGILTLGHNNTGLVNGVWQPPSGTGYTAMLSRITASGANGFEIVIWIQGERDALDGESLAAYAAAEAALAAAVAANVPGPPAFYSVSIGDNGFPAAADLDDIRLAKQQNWAANNTKDGGCTYHLANPEDDVHWKSNTNLQAVADILWATTFGGGTSPEFVSAVATPDRDQILIEFDQDMDTGLTYSTAPWKVTDGGTPMTVSGVQQHPGNNRKFTVSMSAGAAGTLLLSYAPGRTGAGAVVPRSADIAKPTSGSANLVARVVRDMAVSEMSGGGGGVAYYAHL